MASRTLLAGCGKLGARLGERLANEGETVFALRRHTESLPSRVVAIGADLTKPLREPLPVVDAMVIMLPPSVDPDGYRPVLQHLRDGLQEAPSRTVFVSSTGVFEGWDGPQPITESHVPRPATPRARVIREGELVAEDLFGAIIVRPAGIYGPGREYLLRTVRDHRAIHRATRTNRVHETDLVRVLHALLRHEDPPHVIHALDAEPATLGDVTDFIADVLGVEPPTEGDGPGRTGNVFDGTAVRSLVGHLDFPTFREGYRDMIEHAAD
ncbi:hypothetical protein [Demequina sp. NBRC 110052]|uniref:hypothetical protein n=1 Tax=Demequina sp. NBRC 110052 TaxID=1570341 RepID=UPI001F28BC72|nr:hypothetical protein [Demequina sp. NBRC 110052]